ncbi:MAG: CsiV family protein [Gammaproteobacteria bacterium]|nr:CsiV family protein [Gammaproteobacteria bacterium]
MRTFFALVTMAAAWVPCSAEAVFDADDLWQHRWYTIEIILFQRTRAAGETERLTVDTPRRYPLRIVSFVEPVDLDMLDDDTRAQLDQPLFERPVDFEYIDPPDWLVRAMRKETEQPLEADEPAPDMPSPTVEMQELEMFEPAQPTLLEVTQQAFAAFEAELVNWSYVWRRDGLELNADAARLRRVESLQVIRHGKWIQAVPGRSEPQAILVQAGDSVAGGPHRVEGVLSVTLQRFLHVDVQLWLHEAPRWPAPFTGAPFAVGDNTYRILDESRRMRSKELHHLDHPLFGLLVRIDAVEVPPELAELVAALEQGGENFRDIPHPGIDRGAD